MASLSRQGPRHLPRVEDIDVGERYRTHVCRASNVEPEAGAIGVSPTPWLFIIRRSRKLTLAFIIKKEFRYGIW
jgi:hypothetical protein